MRKPAFSLFIASASGHFLKLFYLLTITVQGYAYCLFSSPEPKAHRLAYSIPMLRRPSFVGINNFKHLLLQNSKTACRIKAKFYVEPPWVGGTKVCSRHLGHMTKMAATHIYGKNPSKIFSRTGVSVYLDPWAA